MRKILYLVLAAVLVLAACTGCRMMEQVEAGRSTPIVSDEAAPVDPTPEDMPEPTPEMTPEPTPESTPGPTEDSCAYITAISMAMDGQTDITFDYVDWFYGTEAREKYLTDYPDAEEDILIIIEEIGYIRNTDAELRTYRTGADTQYFLPEPEDLGLISEVDYDTFRNRMFPAVEGTGDTYLTFVKVYVAGETIQKIEWLYTP
jgi:hypothetical protein